MTNPITHAIYPLGPWFDLAQRYPVRTPNGIYDDVQSMRRLELWDNRVIWWTDRSVIDGDQPAYPSGGPPQAVPAWGTYPALPPLPA